MAPRSLRDSALPNQDCFGRGNRPFARAGDERQAEALAAPRSNSEVAPARKHTAVLSAVVLGHAGLMRNSDRTTPDKISVTRSVVASHVGRCGGQVVDATGDSLLAAF